VLITTPISPTTQPAAKYSPPPAGVFMTTIEVAEDRDAKKNKGGYAKEASYKLKITPEDCKRFGVPAGCDTIYIRNYYPIHGPTDAVHAHLLKILMVTYGFDRDKAIQLYGRWDPTGPAMVGRKVPVRWAPKSRAYEAEEVDPETREVRKVTKYADDQEVLLPEEYQRALAAFLKDRQSQGKTANTTAPPAGDLLDDFDGGSGGSGGIEDEFGSAPTNGAGKASSGGGGAPIDDFMASDDFS
jgi:hypothetical protein